MSKLLAMMMKPKNYMYATIKGSLTDNDGIFSGFSSSNYLELQNQITLSKDSNIEIVEKINKPSDKSANSLIGTATRYGFALQGGSSGKLLLYIGNGSSWSVTGGSGKVGTNILDINTDYYIKIKISNSLFNVYISTDNVNYTLDSSNDISSLTTEEQYNLRLGMARNTTNYFNGSIDLNQSYIKINNTKYRMQAVVGYTLVGSPTIVDGVMSSATANNYLTVQVPTTTFDSSTNSIEFDIDITTASSLASSIGLFRHRFTIDGVNSALSISAGSNHKLYIAFKTTTYNSDFVLQASTRYRIRVILANDKIMLYVATGTSNFSKELEFDITSFEGTHLDTFIGRVSGSQWLQNNTIDLNNTYIKINNKLWFNGQPA